VAIPCESFYRFSNALFSFENPSLITDELLFLVCTPKNDSAEGYIMDHYCLYETPGGTLLDTGDVTLEFPFRHTVHCLADVGVCNAGPFYILGDPPMTNSDGTVPQLYTVDYILDDPGRLVLLDLARQAGSRDSGCGTCVGQGGDTAVTRGYRAEVIGVVTTLGDDTTPTLLTITSARTSNGLTMVCPGFEPDGTMIATTPTASPVAAAVLGTTENPTTLPPMTAPISIPPPPVLMMTTPTVTPVMAPTMLIATVPPVTRAPTRQNVVPTQDPPQAVLSQSPATTPTTATTSTTLNNNNSSSPTNSPTMMMMMMVPSSSINNDSTITRRAPSSNPMFSPPLLNGTLAGTQKLLMMMMRSINSCTIVIHAQ
jgi:hypothetical protein